MNGFFANREQFLVFSDNNHLQGRSQNFERYLVNEEHFANTAQKNALTSLKHNFKNSYSILFINDKKSYKFYGLPSRNNDFNLLLPHETSGHPGLSKNVINDLINSVVGDVPTAGGKIFHNWNFSTIIDFHIILNHYEKLKVDQLPRYFANYKPEDVAQANEYNNFQLFKKFMWKKLFINNTNSDTKEMISALLNDSHGEYYLKDNCLIFFYNLPKPVYADSTILENVYRNEFLPRPSTVKPAIQRINTGIMKVIYSLAWATSSGL